MPIEVEKKYRLNRVQFDLVIERLTELDAICSGTEFEVNTLYGSSAIDLQGGIIRLRRTENRAILTYKKRLHSPTSVKHQLEEETEVTDADATDAILRCIGLSPILVYEKRRQSWEFKNTVVELDELPFGHYLEIEGEEERIKTVEADLGLTEVAGEEATYPELTRDKGKQNGSVVEARFD